VLDRVDGAFRAQRQLIDDASHELRSPLAIIRTNLDAAGRDGDDPPPPPVAMALTRRDPRGGLIH
jgi:signal transduction histidine kinase